MVSTIDPDFYSNASSFYWPAFFHNVTNTSVVYEHLLNDVVVKVTSDYQKWVMSITGCLLVGLSGIFPLLLFPHGSYDSSSSSDKTTSQWDSKSGGITGSQLKRLLNFAVGSLLGDVFLHLLPEAWNHARASGSSKHDTLMYLGFWVLMGIVSFVICQKLVSYGQNEDEEEEENEESEGPTITDSFNNNNDKKICSGKNHSKESSHKHVAGYLNLVANAFDNFTHGLAVAGSFIISFRIGLLTTVAILLHEIPHEIADFAILLRAGFNPWSAAKAQLSTATIGLLGAVFTLTVDSMQTMGDYTWWILPFTSGCFINISLTNLLPDLVKEDDPKESLKQFAGILLGIGVMAFVSAFHEG